MDRSKGEPVMVWADVLKGIDAVRATGLTNMLDHRAVSMLAGASGHLAAGQWIAENPTVYVEGVMRGFVAKTLWDAPISDFEDCRCGCGGRVECGNGSR